MGVIYCGRCNIGVHYTDVCSGGANGVPRLEGKQLKKALRINKIADVMLLLVSVSPIVLIICFGFFLLIKGTK